jgi:UDP-N-acetylglucosamine 2-epimerase (non-hydrolysing)
MRIVTVLGTRPEIIRLGLVIPLLDRHCERHVLVHTGQNAVASLKDIFFDELGVRPPDVTLQAGGGVAEQLGHLLPAVDKVLRAEKPDRILILGDTNSGLSAIVAKRHGIKVYHMEAGNRCYDDRVPEEVNRRIIDHCSDVWMPYTERSRQNLLREGVPAQRVFVTGNPIGEVLTHFGRRIEQSEVLSRLGVRAGGYFLATLHRAENVDDASRLKSLTEALAAVGRTYGAPVVVSTHPRTRNRMRDFGLDTDQPHLRFMDPFGFFDFVALERNAKCVLTDSGTVQEECCILMVPAVTLRDTTERPETLECGSNILSGAGVDDVLRAVRTAVAAAPSWTPSLEYQARNVSGVVLKILMGYE